ncbi:helix-turn-helix domain-containing protein [Bacillus mycoides]|uniref:helix-turn-helix domain-containing protein n=1 Tax=Bacillus mycoides TaxID=1405 RepID=UPI0010BE520E|nr:helix-turn-helix domain-containing protein [Bacillus mycoides]MED1406560.1 helix-turn-helix domain-containing protein [Bacillus mycoides]TKI46676.1 MarR family transcriptional regulator [Bacillus mycoides]UNJ96903.1 helix-turn-helix domain-containing protein [Bacillus mycoides]
MSKLVNLEQAEKNARLRDIENSKVLSEEEMYIANELQSKANLRGMKLVPERKVKNKAKFVQIIQDNWSYLQSISYLKNEEIVFLMSLIPFIGFGSNAIVDNPKKKQPLPLTQRELAKSLETSETKVSRVVKALYTKGIIARSESVVENSNVKSYALFINPHILYAGDRDNIEEGLKIQFIKIMRAKPLKDLPIKFF